MACSSKEDWRIISELLLICVFFWKALSCVQLFATPQTIVHGILQARILEWVAYPFSSDSSWPRNQTRDSCIAGGFFTKLSYQGSPLKKAECWRIDAFKLWCWRRLLRVLLDCKEIKPVNPKENQPRIFIGFFGHLMQRTNSLEKPWCWERLKANREGSNGGWDG